MTTNRLRVYRADRRVTQEALEEKTAKLRHRVTQTRISLIENGVIPAEDDEKKVLARALKASIAEVFPDEAVAL